MGFRFPRAIGQASWTFGRGGLQPNLEETWEAGPAGEAAGRRAGDGYAGAGHM